MKAPEELEDIVPEYHSRNPFIRHFFRRRLEIAISLGGLDEGGRLDVLDLGCGEGLFLRLAAARHPGHAYTGWDQHPDVEKLAVPGVVFGRLDMRDPGFAQGKLFDRVFCLDVLEHFEDLAEVASRLMGLVRPGGRLVISAPTESFLYKAARLLVKGTLSSREGPAAGPHYFDAEGVAREVGKAGFVLRRTVKIPSWPIDMFHITHFAPGPSTSGEPA